MIFTSVRGRHSLRLCGITRIGVCDTLLIGAAPTTSKLDGQSRELVRARLLLNRWSKSIAVLLSPLQARPRSQAGLFFGYLRKDGNSHSTESILSFVLPDCRSHDVCRITCLTSGMRRTATVVADPFDRPGPGFSCRTSLLHPGVEELDLLIG